ncbi:MAG: ribose-5-phosphate isomerase A [Alphaproteobacteria bacterium]|nr:MAG: ribose-5-phosphate isomerase A [Alphaproteobacteria bacterium]
MSGELKLAAARAALERVEDGMRLGIGTGSTAEAFIRLLGDRVRAGLSIVGVPTSDRSAALCRQVGVPLTSLDDCPELDLTVDGADEIGPGLVLVKGGGAALLREKIVAGASARMTVIADASKLVDEIGAYPLPIEVNRFGFEATRRAIERAAARLGLSGTVAARMRDGERVVTDEGHYLVDASFGRIGDAEALSRALLDIPGVVQHGMFIGMASEALVADARGIREIRV